MKAFTLTVFVVQLILGECTPDIVIMSNSPVVGNFETTSLVCKDLSDTLSRASFSIRRQFRWGGSTTTESTSSGAVWNDTGVAEKWIQSDTNKAIGGFGCGRGNDAVSVVKMHSNGSLIPEEFSIMASVGSKAVIKMIDKDGRQDELQKITWYKDGHVLDIRRTSRIWDAEGGKTLVINGITAEDAGIYMAHHHGEDQIYAIGTILIVRSCPPDKWSSGCNKTCPNCLNGGICDEETGRCSCLPGFNGTLCDSACPPSQFGQNCKHRCSDIGIEGPTCMGYQQCSTIGCFCMNGWTGLECNQTCPTGYYGAGCKTECNCANGGTCDRFAGCNCATGWTGKSCQISTERNAATDTESPTRRTHPVIPDSPTERKPNITKVVAYPSFKVNERQRVTIECSATGFPAPQHGDIRLQWGNGFEVAPSETKYITENVITSNFTHRMTAYAGPFWCVAKTSAGKTRRAFNFTIPVLPTPKFPPKLVHERPKYLKLKLNSVPFHGDGPIVRTRLLYKKTDGGQSFTAYVGSIRNDTANFNDLDPFTNYTFRVLLTREGNGGTGRGHPGPTAVIRTFCDYPAKGPTITSIYAKNDTILHLSWRLPPIEDINGEVLGYKIYYKVLGDDSPPTRITFGYSSRTSTTLSNMIPLAVYSVKIRLNNCAGDSPDSEEVRVTMGRLEKPAGPVITSMNLTSRTASFDWLPPANAKPYTISGYEVSLKEKSRSLSIFSRLQNVSLCKYIGKSLTPYTEYVFKVRAYNHEGPGNYSETKIIKTAEEAPGKPSNFRVYRISTSTIALAWEDPIQPNGIIRTYIMNYTSLGGKWHNIVVGQKRQITVENLLEYHDYHFKIQAVTIDPGNWTDILSQKTMTPAPLESPKSIRTERRSPQSVQVSWSPPPKSEYVHDIREYKIAYTDDLRQNIEHWATRIVNGKRSSIEINGLRSYTVYGFAVAAVTQNAGPYSETSSIRTMALIQPPPPTDVSVSNITSHNALIKWKVVEGFSVANVRIRIKNAGADEWTALFYPFGTREATIGSLSSGTVYNIELIAINSIGQSSPYSTNFQTKAGTLVANPSILIPVAVGGSILLLVIIIVIIYLRCCRQSDLDNFSTNGLELDAMAKHRGIHRRSTIGSSFNAGAITSRSGTLLSSHSVHSENSKAPSNNYGQLILPERLILLWENIFFEDITLGEGNFGQVVKAIIQIDEKCIDAAVKTLRDGCSLDDRKDFLAELEMMVRLGKHQNIISLIGACEHNSTLYLCTEYAPNGNLLQFLRKSRKSGGEATYTYLTQGQLLQFALDICQGMAYLSDKELIHRDLAARNVLLAANLTCKIADFGLSRGEGVYVKRTVARLPIRWMAIESLNYNVYTTQSDVWSFGVVLWEIVSLGGTPYYGMSCAELYEKLPKGYRMEQPLNCDGEIYKLMCQCWKDRPHERPSFSQLSVALRRMIDARTNVNYVNTAIFENFSFFKIDANEEEED